MNSPQINSKLPKVGTTIFTVMSGLASEYKAVNLGQGFPDYPMNEELISLVDKAMKNGFNQYAPSQGWMPLRETIAEKIVTLYGTAINPNSEITITPGGTYAIYSALTAIVQHGDEVIVFEPAYDSYIPNVEINGGVVVPIKLIYPEYKIDWNEIKKRITKKTKAIILNSPHNPTGSVLTASDIKELKNIVADSNVFIVSDEVYEHLIFDGLEHHSILKYPELFARAFVCFSFGKVYHCTGWKLGYCVAPAALMSEFRKVHQFNCFTCFTPAQVALADFLKKESLYTQLGSFLQAKRDKFVSLMKNSRFTLHASSGSYFICGSYEKISDEPDQDFAVRLTKEHGIATIPVSAFYHNNHDDKVLRFCFSKKDETLEAAVQRLSNL